MGTGKHETMYPGIEMDYHIRVFDISEGNVALGGKSFPLNPMIGVIGVAPAEGSLGTLVPASHGGNMDCTRIRQGSIIYLPVSVPGALLALGDIHAIMGDGEIFMYGLETGGEVTVKVNVIKGKSLRMPVVIDNDIIAAIASAETLDKCSVLAVKQLYDLMLNQGWKPEDLWYLMSLKCNLAVCQIVNPNMTVRAEISRELLRDI